MRYIKKIMILGLFGIASIGWTMNDSGSHDARGSKQPDTERESDIGETTLFMNGIAVCGGDSGKACPSDLAARLQWVLETSSIATAPQQGTSIFKRTTSQQADHLLNHFY